MGVVIPLVQPLTQDEAWRKYAELAAMLSENTSLLTNREFQQEFAKAHERWKQLYLADCEQ